MIAFAIIWFTLVLIWDLRTDYRKWKRAPFDHKKKWQRGVLLTPSILAFALPIGGALFFKLVFSWFLVGFVYWVLFDGLFNIIRRLPWNYVGTPDDWDSKLDELQRKYEWLYIAKIIVAAGLITTYILIL